MFDHYYHHISERLFAEKGLPYLTKEFPKLKFKGKGHEVIYMSLLSYELFMSTFIGLRSQVLITAI